jgi:hypothetical protein
LPFAWLVNFFWFFEYAFKGTASPEQKQMRNCENFNFVMAIFNLKVNNIFFTDLIQSAIGVTVWTVLLVTWNVLFQSYRVEWGAVGDQLTFILPRGKP